MIRFLSILMVTLFTTTAFAGFQGINGTTNLGIFNKVTCSTGLTCTKVADAFSIVSSPTISTGAFSVQASTSTAATVDLKANANASNGDDWQLKSTTSQGGIQFLNNTSGSQVSKMALTTGGNLSCTGTFTPAGAIVPTGGIAPPGSALKTRYSTWAPEVVTNATSATPAATSVYMAQIYVPYNMTLTGIGVLNAATVGTNKYVVAIFNDAGTALANSATAGVLTAGASAYQQVAFTSTVAVLGPKTYWVGVYVNGTTDRYYAQPTLAQAHGLAGEVTGQTFGTVANVTLPTTFTADKGPVAYVY
jgi:hypothetical protein